MNQDLAVRDRNGEIYSVRYEAVNAMLLNEFLKQHQTVQELKEQVAELTAVLQRVSAQLELSESAPQTVLERSLTLFARPIFERAPKACRFTRVVHARSDPNGIRTQFELFAALRDTVTNMR